MSTDRQKRALHLRRIREDPMRVSPAVRRAAVGLIAVVGLVALGIAVVFLVSGEW